VSFESPVVEFRRQALEDAKEDLKERRKEVRLEVKVGKVEHEDLPDRPTVLSEELQVLRFE
jgi:hypothetical protein